MFYVQFSWPFYWLTRSERASEREEKRSKKKWAVTHTTLKYNKYRVMIRKSSSTFSMKSDILNCHTHRNISDQCFIGVQMDTMYLCSLSVFRSLFRSRGRWLVSCALVCVFWAFSSIQFEKRKEDIERGLYNDEQVCDRSMYCSSHIYNSSSYSFAHYL